MGYYIHTESCECSIPEEKLADAWKAVCALNENDEIKRGGSWGSEGRLEAWFSFVDPDYPNTLKDINQFLNHIGFETEMRDGFLWVISYNDKSGQEEIFFEALAPYITDGSRIIWHGEDHEAWMWEFRNGKFVHLKGETVFKESDYSPIAYARSMNLG